MIDRQRIDKSTLYQELTEEDRCLWFDQKTKKFLHNIDTFYYSVKLAEDFTHASQDENVLAFRRVVDRIKKRMMEKAYFGDYMELYVPGKGNININRQVFSMYYSFNLKMPDEFDIFIAPFVPGNEHEISVTSEIIVQIRAEALWSYGASGAFERSFEWVKAICDLYHFTIMEVKENRADFCWHSNYIENPNKFFKDENCDAMRCTTLGRKTNYIRVDKGSNDSEFSYYSRGQRGDKTFLRIYNKTMEVVEQGYKSFFLPTWLHHGLINRYDFEILEAAYKRKSWRYVDIARLQFYADHGADPLLVNECKEQILLHELSGSYTDKMIRLADELTPPVSIIINVEFQLMRKASKSYEIRKIKDNSEKGVCQRIYDYLDNRKLIADYLTGKVFRLVEKTGDSNKSRRPDVGFWAALRSCKMVDVAPVPDDLKMRRIYHRKLNAELLKQKALNAAIAYGVYMKGINTDAPIQDAADVLCRMNDNDIKKAEKYKDKYMKQINKALLADVMPKQAFENAYEVVNLCTGELISPLTDDFESGFDTDSGS